MRMKKYPPNPSSPLERIIQIRKALFSLTIGKHCMNPNSKPIELPKSQGAVCQHNLASKIVFLDTVSRSTMPQVYPLPSAESIQQLEPKQRPLPVEPWVVAELSRVWQSMKKNIQHSIVSDTAVRPHTDQSTPACVRNHS